MFLRTRAFQFALTAGLAGIFFAALSLTLTSETGFGAARVIFFASPAFFALTGFLLGRRADSLECKLRLQEEHISEATERMAELALAAIIEQEYKVELYDRSLPTCWEVKDCSYTDCPVYGKQNVRCWYIAGTYCGGEVQGHFAQKIGDCAHCDVYQAALSQDATSGVTENFNNLLWTVNETTNALSAINQELRIKYSELELLQEETRRQAETDALTGLYNYRHFNGFLEKKVAIAKRYGKVFSILLLDLDDFKSINEHYGYKKGDEVLRLFADKLRAATQPEDYVARYSNEEFIILLHDIEGEKALSFARRLAADAGSVAAAAEIADSGISISIGVADYPDCAVESQSLLSAADTALFFAKSRATSDVAYFCDLSETELGETDINRLKNRLHGAGLDTLKALAKAVDASDQYLNTDRELINLYAHGIAGALGMDEDEAELLELATSLHDIGKIGVPTEILGKRDKLLPAELEIIKKHPQFGQEILREARQLQELVLAILYHHERWDGSGYPEQLSGERIPIMARIVGIFDAYRAMRCDRPYRKALTMEKAIAELRKGAGTQFDPELVELFITQLRDTGDALRDTG